MAFDSAHDAGVVPSRRVRQILSVRELIKGLGGAPTIILSTHILPEVSQVCERVLIINHG